MNVFPKKLRKVTDRSPQWERGGGSRGAELSRAVLEEEPGKSPALGMSLCLCLNGQSQISGMVRGLGYVCLFF